MTGNNNEIWKDIPGYEGRYQASSLGKVRRLVPNIAELKTYPNKKKKGYEQLVLCKDGVKTKCRVHQLVARTFLGEKPPGQIVRHLDGNPSNNAIDNLAYGTASDNKRDDLWLNQTRVAKIKPEYLTDIRARIARGETYVSIARDYGVNGECISAIAKGRTWGWCK